MSKQDLRSWVRKGFIICSFHHVRLLFYIIKLCTCNNLTITAVISPAVFIFSVKFILFLISSLHSSPDSKFTSCTIWLGLDLRPSVKIKLLTNHIQRKLYLEKRHAKIWPQKSSSCKDPWKKWQNSKERGERRKQSLGNHVPIITNKPLKISFNISCHRKGWLPQVSGQNALGRLSCWVMRLRKEPLAFQLILRY